MCAYCTRTSPDEAIKLLFSVAIARPAMPYRVIEIGQIAQNELVRRLSHRSVAAMAILSEIHRRSALRRLPLRIGHLQLLGRRRGHRNRLDLALLECADVGHQRGNVLIGEVLCKGRHH